MNVSKILEYVKESSTDIEQFNYFTKDFLENVNYQTQIETLLEGDSIDDIITKINDELLIPHNDKIEYIKRCYYLRTGNDIPDNIIERINKTHDNRIDIFSKYFVYKNKLNLYILETGFFDALDENTKCLYFNWLFFIFDFDALNIWPYEYHDINISLITNHFFVNSLKKNLVNTNLLNFKPIILSSIVKSIGIDAAVGFAKCSLFDNKDAVVEHISYFRDNNLDFDLLVKILLKYCSADLIEYLVDNELAEYEFTPTNLFFPYIKEYENNKLMSELINKCINISNAESLMEEMMNCLHIEDIDSYDDREIGFFHKTCIISNVVMDTINKDDFNEYVDTRTIEQSLMYLNHFRKNNYSKEHDELLKLLKKFKIILDKEIIADDESFIIACEIGFKKICFHGNRETHKTPNDIIKTLIQNNYDKNMITSYLNYLVNKND